MTILVFENHSIRIVNNNSSWDVFYSSQDMLLFRKPFICSHNQKRCNLFLLALGLEDLLNDLLFLNQESANNSVANAVRAARSAIGTADGLLSLGDLSVLT